MSQGINKILTSERRGSFIYPHLGKTVSQKVNKYVAIEITRYTVHITFIFLITYPSMY